MQLIAKDLFKKYKYRVVVNGVNITVNQGEIVGLLGPNGAGKTTTFHMFVGLVRPTSGSVYIDNINVTKLPMYKRCRQGLGYLPQESSIFRGMTVENNLMSIAQLLPISQNEQQKKVDLLLQTFGLYKLRKQISITLSGGEKRRLEIARALIINPKFLLLDEPFVGIDPITVEDIQHIIKKLKYMNFGVFITDHNVRETLEVIDRAYIIYEGKILFEGNAIELLNNSQSKAVYLGNNFRM
ncbi:MAG: LPS export ABC transporter ATP-binding protein [Endomicrobium sp.]|jgi:lipopolysaccharide export system ATP-binding protein|nr:LPS export ABC transporter ATP-binding protein [Endomicrobium sp.]